MRVVKTIISRRFRYYRMSLGRKKRPSLILSSPTLIDFPPFVGRVVTVIASQIISVEYPN